MKRSFNATCAIVLSTIVIASCAKELDVKLLPEEAAAPEMVTLTFKAEKAGEETKTAADVGATSVSYKWTDDDEDYIKVYLVDGSTLTEVTSIANKVSDTQMTITAEVPKADNYTIRAILAREFYSKGQPMVSKYQSPKTDNFDPKGDILFSEDKEITTTGDMTDELLLTFHRKLTVNKMTLKELGAGEKVKQVTISSDKALVGYFNGSSIVDTGDPKSIVLTYNNVEVPDSKQFPVFFTCMPNAGQTLSVNVVTDSKIYSKTFTKTIDFALGKFTTFNVTLPSGYTEKWELVTSASDALQDGDIIVLANADADKAMSTTQNKNNRGVASVSSSDGGKTISIDSDTQQITLEATSTNFYMSVGDSNYLYAPGGGNYLRSDTKTNAETAQANSDIWSISVADDGAATIVSQASVTQDDLRYNGTNSLFSCYNDSQDLPVIYRKKGIDAKVWNLKTLTVTKQPTHKNDYSRGDAFNPTGMIVTATYEENGNTSNTKDVVIANTDLTFSPTILSASDEEVIVSYCNKTATITGIVVSDSEPKWTKVTTLGGLKNGTYALGVYSSSKYYTAPGTTVSGQDITCAQASYSDEDGLTPATGAGVFTLTAVSEVSNAFYIYNTSLEKYLVATGEKTFGYVTSSSSDYGYWTFSTVASGGFSGVFNITHNSKTHYMRANSNVIKCYNGASNNGVYFFLYE